MQSISGRGNSKYHGPEVVGERLILIKDKKIFMGETSWGGRVAFVGAREAFVILFLF